MEKSRIALQEIRPFLSSLSVFRLAVLTANKFIVQLRSYTHILVTGGII